MSPDSPIGVFDSGVGGLSVLKAIQQLLPAEELLYVADSAWAPYGPRSREEILGRCREIMAFFSKRRVKAVVIACNTATAAAVADLRLESSIPIVAMEPGIKPAAEQSRSGVIGVLATEGTIESDKFISLKSRFSDRVEIITVACRGLVDNIEKLESDLAERRALLHAYIAPVVEKGADTLILGCTHYPLIRDEIIEVAGPGVSVIDTGVAVARELQRRLGEVGLLRVNNEGEVTFFSSGEPEFQSCLLGQYWGAPLSVFPLMLPVL